MAILDTIKELSRQAPVFNGQARQAQAQQVQQAMQQAPNVGNIAGQAQAVAPSIAQARGQQAVQAQAQQQQQLAYLGQQAIQQKGFEAEQRIAQQQGGQEEYQQTTELARQKREQASDIAQKKRFTEQENEMYGRVQDLGLDVDNRLSFLNRKQRTDLASLGSDLRSKLFDSRMAFERDEMGRKFSNQRQLADYAVVSAQNNEDLMNKAQEMQQSAQKEIIMLEAAHNKLTQTLEHEYKSKKQRLDNETRIRIAQQKAALKKEIAKKKARASNITAIFTAAGTVGGAYFGGAPGAIAGKGAGQAVGSIVAQETA